MASVEVNGNIKRKRDERSSTKKEHKKKRARKSQHPSEKPENKPKTVHTEANGVGDDGQANSRTSNDLRGTDGQDATSGENLFVDKMEGQRTEKKQGTEDEEIDTQRKDLEASAELDAYLNDISPNLPEESRNDARVEHKPRTKKPESEENSPGGQPRKVRRGKRGKKVRKSRDLVDDLFQNDPKKEPQPGGVRSSSKKIKYMQKEPKKPKANGYTRSQSSTWASSKPVGGKFLDLPLLFSNDEEHIFFATEGALHVYSTETSLPERSLSTEQNGAIIAYSLSKVNPDTILVSTIRSQIIAWDWTIGKKLGRWKTDAPIYSLTVTSLGHGKEEDVVFTIDRSQRAWEITAHCLRGKYDEKKTELVSLLKYDEPLRSLKIVNDGRTIFAISSETLLIGKRSKHHGNDFADLQYSWQEIKCPEPPLCFDVQASGGIIDVVIGGLKGCILVYQNLVQRLGMSKTSLGTVERASRINARELHWHREGVAAVAWSLDGNYVVSGGRETVLVLWQLETGRKQFLPHLESPITNLTISPSGSSYAVALGDNSVMVLSTSEMKPTANVAGLQSPSLADPPTHQTLLATKELLSQVRRNEASLTVPSLIHPRLPNALLAAVPSSQPSNNIFPSTVPFPYLQTFDLQDARHISRQGLTRTGATDTNLAPSGQRIHPPTVTHLQISSNGRWLVTVDVWTPPREDFESLAVDAEDVELEMKRYTEVNLQFWSWQEVENRSSGTNVDREDSHGAWQLNTRIATPHEFDELWVIGKILDVAAHPKETYFVTIGDDYTARIWSMKSKLPNGKVVRGERTSATKAPIASKSKKRTSNEPATWWTLKSTIHLPRAHSPNLLHYLLSEAESESEYDHDPLTPLAPTRCLVAFSNDGSALAAYLHSPGVAEPIVHFINTRDFSIRESRPNLSPNLPPENHKPKFGKYRPKRRQDDIHALAFIDRHLLVLSRATLAVWDVTTFDLVMHIPLPAYHRHRFSSNKKPQSKPPPPQLSVNIPTSTFALAIPVPTNVDTGALAPHPWRDWTTRLLVFSAPNKFPGEYLPSPPEDQPEDRGGTCLLDQTLPKLVLRLISAAGEVSGIGTHGFTVEKPGSQDSAAQSKRILGEEISRDILRRGFVAVDVGAYVRRIVPGVPTTAATSSPAPNLTESDLGENDEGEQSDAATTTTNRGAASSEPIIISSDDESRASAEHSEETGTEQPKKPVLATPRIDAPERRVVRPEELAAVVDPAGSEGAALPGVVEMFEGVLRLYAGRQA